jgi:hypothetical protein
LTGRTSWMSFQSQGAPLTPSRYSRTFDLPTSIKPNELGDVSGEWLKGWQDTA